MSKRTRGEKGEQLVSSLLETIKEYKYILNDVTFLNKKSEMTHQIDHILIHPHGIFIIETKNYYGKISVPKDEPFWIKEVNGEKIQIANPLKQNKSHAITVWRLLKGKYNVIPVVVFVQNNAPYLGDENVINLDDLLLFIESYPYQRKYQKKTIDEINKIISRKVSKVTKEEHLENISYLKQIKKEIKNEITYAVENNICPRCGSKMLSKGYSYCCSKCNFNFKL